MNKDIDILVNIRFTLEANKDKENEYNEKVNIVVAGLKEFMGNTLGFDTEVEVVSEDGAEDLFLY